MSLLWIHQDASYVRFAGQLLYLEVQELRASAVVGICGSPILQAAWAYFFPTLEPDRVIKRLSSEGDLLDNFKRALRVTGDVKL